jgi:ribosomal protein L40E
METAKLSKESERKPIRHSSTSTAKKAFRNKVESAGPLPKETASKSKLEKLICRYCGSDDLVPSFIKRRDRRCRRCFSKRYGSVARARKAKVKK